MQIFYNSRQTTDSKENKHMVYLLDLSETLIQML